MNNAPLTCREVEEAMEVAAKVGQFLFSKIHPNSLQVFPRKVEQVDLIVDLVGDAAAVYRRSRMLEREFKRAQSKQAAPAAIVIVSKREDEK